MISIIKYLSINGAGINQTDGERNEETHSRNHVPLLQRHHVKQPRLQDDGAPLTGHLLLHVQQIRAGHFLEPQPGRLICYGQFHRIRAIKSIRLYRGGWAETNSCRFFMSKFLSVSFWGLNDEK